jgi:hypothetical protein
MSLDRLLGEWQLHDQGATWEHDYSITYRRVSR